MTTSRAIASGIAEAGESAPARLLVTRRSAGEVLPYGSASRLPGGPLAEAFDESNDHRALALAAEGIGVLKTVPA